MSITSKIIGDWLSTSLRRSSQLANTFHHEEPQCSFYYDTRLPTFVETKQETLTQPKFLRFPKPQPLFVPSHPEGLQGLGKTVSLTYFAYFE